MPRILYIEDDFANRLLIRRVLMAEGYELLEAENGLSGYDMAMSQKPDLILMDINLPDIDGYECASRIRKNELIADIPIIALTANAMIGDRERAMAAGCNGYISKPVDIDLLPDQIAAHLH
jgi:two-component system cell cycle response regulator DivK